MGVRVKDEGQFKEIYVKALDSLPVGAEIDFDGQVSDIPIGWEEVDNVLWTNPSPTSTFSGQTLSIDLTNYKALDIYCLRYNATDRHILHYKILLDSSYTTSQLFYSDYDNGVRSWNRNVNWATNSITFGNATINGSSSNGALIPYKIVGIKEE